MVKILVVSITLLLKSIEFSEFDIFPAYFYLIQRGEDMFKDVMCVKPWVREDIMLARSVEEEYENISDPSVLRSYWEKYHGGRDKDTLYLSGPQCSLTWSNQFWHYGQSLIRDVRVICKVKGQWFWLRTILGLHWEFTKDTSYWYSRRKIVSDNF